MLCLPGVSVSTLCVSALAVAVAVAVEVVGAVMRFALAHGLRGLFLNCTVLHRAVLFFLPQALGARPQTQGELQEMLMTYQRQRAMMQSRRLNKRRVDRESDPMMDKLHANSRVRRVASVHALCSTRRVPCASRVRGCLCHRRCPFRFGCSLLVTKAANVMHWLSLCLALTWLVVLMRGFVRLCVCVCVCVLCVYVCVCVCVRQNWNYRSNFGANALSIDTRGHSIPVSPRFADLIREKKRSQAMPAPGQYHKPSTMIKKPIYRHDPRNDFPTASPIRTRTSRSRSMRSRSRRTR